MNYKQAAVEIAHFFDAYPHRHTQYAYTVNEQGRQYHQLQIGEEWRPFAFCLRGMIYQMQKEGLISQGVADKLERQFQKVTGEVSITQINDSKGGREKVIAAMLAVATLK